METEQKQKQQNAKPYILQETSERAPMPLSTIYAHLLNFRSTRLLTELNGHSGPVISLAISPNGKMLASGGRQHVSCLKQLN